MPHSVQSTRKQWTIIIASVVLLHAAFLFLFNPQYLRVFKTDVPPGEEGTDRYPFLDNPLRVLSLSVESRPAAAVTEKKAAETAESAEDAARVEAIGEPQSEMLPLRGGGGGGTRGSRNATVEPKPLYIPWPKYPAGIKQLPQGRVELMLLINEKGEVDDVKVTRTLPLEELNRIAVEAARRIRFTPGTEQGIRKPMWVRLAIGFQPR
ncbi:MAG: TonB family protein [Candidatus Krumholzibacteria bacterium]|nr:TonB family protein [Candidatus Krumholzibacteria bacterium]